MRTLKEELTQAFYGDTTETRPEPECSIEDKYIDTVRRMGYEMEYLEPALRTNGNHLIVSGAGAGKTTMLTIKVALDVQTGELTKIKNSNGKRLRVLDKVWVCTFLKTGAEELKQALSKWNRKLGVIDTSRAIAFSTLHAEFKKALDSYGFNNTIIESKDEKKIFTSMVKRFELVNTDGSVLGWDESNGLKSALSYTRNRLDDTRFDIKIYSDLGLTESVVQKILDYMKAERQKLGVVDFEDLQEDMLQHLKTNSKFADFIGTRYKYIYIDEFQDTSQIQYEILKYYTVRQRLGVGKITAIGDDDQTIYSWRGSDHRIITKWFIDDYKPAVSTIGKNYRCPSNILNPVIPSIEKNTPRLDKVLSASREGGIFRVGRFNSYAQMAKVIPNEVYKAVARGKSVAILCRTNADGIVPALNLEIDSRVSFSVSSKKMTLSNSYGRRVTSICKILTEKSSRDVETVLRSLTYDKSEATRLMQACKSENKFFWHLNTEDVRYSCPGMWNFISSVAHKVKEDGKIAALKYILLYYRTNIYKYDNGYSEMMRSLLDIYLTQLQTRDWEDIPEYLEEMDILQDRLHGRIKAPRVDVTISTVHEYKGKEADVIFLWNDTEGVFPSKQSTTFDEFQEERRVHYIACTRAKEEMTILTIRGNEGSFLQEMDLDNAEPVDSQEVQSIELGKPRSDAARKQAEMFIAAQSTIIGDIG